MEAETVATLASEAIRRKSAELVVDCDAVTFRTEPFFRFTSGVESPIYVDNRLLIGHPIARRTIVDYLVANLYELRLPTLDALAGTATAGIPWASWLADRLEVPLLYVRGRAKSWGHERKVEGCAKQGGNVVVIEDLIYSAGSAVASAENLRSLGYRVSQCLAIVSYDSEKSSHRLKVAGLHASALTSIDDAVAVAVDRGKISRTQSALIGDWLREDRRLSRNDGIG